MAVAVIVVIGIAALAFMARSARRAWSDRHSLEEHHRALGTLGQIAHQQEAVLRPPAERASRAHVRVVPAGDERPAPPPGSLSPTANEAEAHPIGDGHPIGHAEASAVVPLAATGPGGDDHRTDAEAPVVVPLAPPGLRPTRPPPTPPEVAARLVARTVDPAAARDRPLHARQQSRLRGSVVGCVGVAAAVVAVIAAVALSHDGADPRQGAGRGPAARVAPAATAAAGPSPPASPAVLVASNSQGATFSLASAANIELVSTSNCWLQVRSGSAGGPVLYVGLLHPGQHFPLPGRGPVWLRLGNPPAVAVVVNGTPLRAPLPSTAQPYNLEFQLASSSGASTTG